MKKKCTSLVKSLSYIAAKLVLCRFHATSPNLSDQKKFNDVDSVADGKIFSFAKNFLNGKLSGVNFFSW